MLIGAQLYSVAVKCDTPEHICQTMETMKQYGYQSVQISGFAYDAAQVRACADRLGLHIGLTHTDIPQILQNTDQVIHNHKLLGADVVGVGYPAGYIQDGKVDIDRLIADLNPVSKKLEQAGLKLAYHNHAMEFEDLGGYCLMDVLQEKTEWNFTLDTGWADYAGADAVKAIRKYADRLEYVHIKDFRHALQENEDAVARIVPIYAGDTPMDAIMQALQEVGTVKVAYVEQDNANTAADPYGEMKKSIDALRVKGFVK